ncbi:DnaQ-like DNA polymerase III subunit [Mycobacterium phage Nebkiss]|nr:DnaQ-like DNA polymerase III subunit [Mycobacterium phage Nebkiss]
MGALAKILNDAPGKTITEGVRSRILILDVERLPGITKQYWWDRGDLKNRYIHYETVEREPRTTIVCAKWYDSPDVIQLAEWDKGGRKKFLKEVHKLLQQADIVVGHNVDQADLPWLRGDMHIEAGLPPLPPFKTVDTLKVLRTEFKSGAPFKSLDAFCQIAGIPSKTDAYDRHAMERAVEGSVEDQERLTAYCVGDVLATQGLYDFLRPHIRNHPALLVDGSDSLTTCNRCGSQTKPIAKRYVANVMTYSMQRCTNCGGHSRLSIEPQRMSIARGV